MKTNVLVTIRNMHDLFTPSEKKIADYITNNLKETLSLSIGQLSKKCGTSEASISRFCRTLNMDGYQSFRIALSQEITDEESEKIKRTLFERINEKDTVRQIVDKISMASAAAIESTRKIVDIENMEKAIKVMDKAHKIVIFGVGASAIVGLDMQYKFSRIDIPTFMFMDSHMQITTASLLKKGDVALAISNSGKTKDVLDALKVAKKNGAITISITQSGNSPIHELSDIVLNTVYVENNFRSGATSSRIAQLSIIDSLFIGVACRRYDDVVNKLEVTRNAIYDR